MSILRYLEYYLARLLINSKGRDAKLLTRSPLFATIPQTITVTSPELGPSPAHMTTEHSALGTSRFPELEWSMSSSVSDPASAKANAQAQVKEYILICEDPDAPLPIVPNHGMFYAIPPTKTRVGPQDFKPLSPSQSEAQGQQQAGAKFLAGGFRLGKNLRGSVYGGPRPPVGHGEHRYFYQVVALAEKLDTSRMKPVATRDELLREMEGKIVAWGEWIGIYENKW